MPRRLVAIKPTETLADLSLLLVAITWGSTYVIVKLTLQSTPLFSFIFMRYVLAGMFLLFFNLTNLGKIDKRLVVDGSILGVILFLGYSLQTLGLRLTPAPIMAFTTGLYVVIVPFLQAVVLKLQLRFEALVGVGFAVIGLMFITIHDEVVISSGMVFGILCAFFYAAHITMVHRFSRRNDFNLLTFFQLGVVGVLSFFAAWIKEPYILPPSFDRQLIFALVVTGILGTALAFVVMIGMQKHTTPTKAAVIYMMESPSSIVFNFWLLGQLLTAKQYIGISFIFLAMLVTQASTLLHFGKRWILSNTDRSDG
jgi:drug/metabolite transporter (DMT)-like permease